MSLFTSLRSLVSTLLHRSLPDGEMEEELRSHIQHRADVSGRSLRTISPSPCYPNR